MYIHIALFRWKPDVSETDVSQALRDVESLKAKIPDIVEITCARNQSRYAEGYTHVVLVRARTQAAMDAYRAHPDHVTVANKIDAMEDHGIGVDFMSMADK